MKSVKFIGILILLILPVVVVVMIFSPLANRRAIEEMQTDYGLADQYTRQDIYRVVDRMREDFQFQLYFNVLQQDQIESITSAAADVLLNHRDQKSLLSEIQKRKEQVFSVSQLFFHFDYSEDFYRNPAAYEGLDSIMWQFIIEEMKLSIITLCYKSTYDSAFSLQWEESMHKAVQKFISIQSKIRKTEMLNKENPKDSVN